MHVPRTLIMEYKGRDSFDAAFKLNAIDPALTEGNGISESWGELENVSKDWDEDSELN